MANALPDLKLLRIFASVVRHQGFANAQQALNLSTSAISTYMSQLEANLGLVLCHRGRGGFSLTSKGELFHQETLRLLGELARLTDSGLPVHIHIGNHDMWMFDYLPREIACLADDGRIGLIAVQGEQLRVQSDAREQRVNLHLALGGDFAPAAPVAAATQ